MALEKLRLPRGAGPPFVSPRSGRRRKMVWAMFNQIDVLKDAAERLENLGRHLDRQLVLSKLAWAAPSHSEVQLRDAANLIRAGCDVSYLKHWAGELGLDDLLAEVLA